MPESERSTAKADALVRAIHAGPLALVLAATGGGSLALSRLLTVPGASRSVLEGIVPYEPEALIDWLGAVPEQFCSERTARAMALVAYRRARRLTAKHQPAPAVAGLGITASLASDRPKRGPHRVHLAWQTRETTCTRSVELEKGKRSRADEERLVADLALDLIAAGEGIAERPDLDLSPSEKPVERRYDAPPAWQALLAGESQLAPASGMAAADRPGAVFPGAFHPLHAGHQRIAEITATRLEQPVAFEISIDNVDKLPLDYLEMADRARQFGDDRPLWFTRAATFVEKSELFPGAWFVVGVDTIARIADPRYYGAQPDICGQALKAIAERGCRFLVFGREWEGRFCTLADLRLPPGLAAICEGLSDTDFRLDIRSRDLRRTTQADDALGD